jgi:TRAP-type C4-dicarboxylate transport system substrate-binding protein
VRNKGMMLFLTCVILVVVMIAGCASPAPSSSSSAPAAPKTTAPATSAAPTAATDTTTPAPTAPATTTAAKPAETIKLVFSSHDPETGWEVQNCSIPWVKKVNDATKGVVNIQAYYGESLIKGTAALEAVKGGQADIAWLAMGFFPGVATLTEAIALPFMPIPTSEIAGRVLWDTYMKYPSMQKQFGDLKVLAFCVLGPFNVVTKDKPIKTLADFQGLKLRVLGGPPTDSLKALGGVPVPMGVTDVYENISKGVLDGTTANWEMMMSFKIYEVVKNYTYAPFSYAFFAVTMNGKKWASLSPEIQNQIMSVSGRDGSAWWSLNMSDKSAEAGRALVKSKGTTMNEYTPPADELAKWVDVAGKPIWDKWQKDNEAKGLTDAKPILDDLLAGFKAAPK